MATPDREPAVIGEPMAVAAVVALLTAAAFWAERRFRWAARVGAALLTILLGALVSNLGLVPRASPVYEGIFGPVTSLAIVWLLFAVRLDDLRRAGPRMAGAFGLAMAATAIGAAIMAWFLAPAFGPEAWKLGGVMTGTYSGGSLNFVAVGRALELPASLFSATAAADNVVTAVWMGATLVLPLWMTRFWRVPVPDAALTELRDPPAGTHGADAEAGTPEGEQSAADPLFGDERLSVRDLSLLLGLGLAILWAAAALEATFPVRLPAVVWLTTLALLVAQLPAVRALRGAMHIGYLALHLFFTVIGIGSRLDEMLSVGPEVIYLTAGTVAIHGLIVYGGGWLARLDVGTLSVASQAAVGGPPTALAVAVGRGWPGLALPGIAVGLLGYALGNYAGLGVAYALRAGLGG